MAQSCGALGPVRPAGASRSGLSSGLAPRAPPAGGPPPLPRVPSGSRRGSQWPLESQSFPHCEGSCCLIPRSGSPSTPRARSRCLSQTDRRLLGPLSVPCAPPPAGAAPCSRGLLSGLDRAGTERAPWGAPPARPPLQGPTPENRELRLWSPFLSLVLKAHSGFPCLPGQPGPETRAQDSSSVCPRSSQCPSSDLGSWWKCQLRQPQL